MVAINKTGPTRHVAVIGSGAAALGAVWGLYAQHQVTVFEQGDYTGGHANTVDISTDAGMIPVDTGFIVYNERTYPQLIQMFEDLKVPTCKTDMSFAVTLDDGRLEYSGGSLRGLFGQPVNLLRPHFLGMIRDILRFYREAPLLLADNSLDVTLGHYVSQHGYGSSFVHDHLLPMAGAIWSAPAQTMLDFPVVSFVRFCVNHGLLQLSDRPQWRTVTGGSREYVRRLLEATKVPVRLNSPVLKISRSTQGVTLHTAQGAETFDDVVIGVHADQALSLLDYPTRHEQQTLSAFQYQKNLAVLHSDSSLMPKRKGVWAAWNYLGKAGADGARHLSVTYWMNRLQHLPCAQPILVTLNPGTMPRDNLVFRQFDYDHPLFDTGAMLAQSRLPLLQGQGGTHTWYCGSYFGYGFHEDAFASGVAAAQSLCHSTMVPS